MQNVVQPQYYAIFPKYWVFKLSTKISNYLTYLVSEMGFSILLKKLNS